MIKTFFLVVAVKSGAMGAFQKDPDSFSITPMPSLVTCEHVQSELRVRYRSRLIEISCLGAPDLTSLTQP